jgi:hypothetical protein
MVISKKRRKNKSFRIRASNVPDLSSSSSSSSEAAWLVADHYRVDIKKDLPKNLWRVDYHNPNTLEASLKAGIRSQIDGSAFPGIDEEFTLAVRDLLRKLYMGPVSQLSGGGFESGFVALWDTKQGAEDTMMSWDLDFKDDGGYWVRSKILRDKLDDEKVFGAEKFVADLPEIDAPEDDVLGSDNSAESEIALKASDYKGVFLIWGGVKPEAVEQHMAISEQRLWELSLCQETMDDLKQGIRLGVLQVADKPGGVVDLRDIAKRLRNEARKKGGARTRGALAASVKGKEKASIATEESDDDDDEKERKTWTGVD